MRDNRKMSGQKCNFKQIMNNINLKQDQWQFRFKNLARLYHRKLITLRFIMPSNYEINHLKN